MAVLLGIIGFFVGGLLADADPIGWVAGALIGVLWARIGHAGKELAALRERVASLETLRAAQVATAAARAAQQAVAAAPAAAADGPRVVLDERGAPIPEPSASTASAGVPAETADVATPASPAAEAPRSAVPPPLPRPAPADSWRQDAPTPRPVIRAPSEPDLFTRAGRAIWGWFTEGNVPVKVGMVVLFFGVAALLRYASDQGLFSVPIGLRLAGIAAVALAALWFAWGKRESRRNFALSLQGGALGVLLLTVFAAFGRYQLLEALPAFAMVLLLVAACGLLAVLQNALALAVLGTIGGFLAPVLISTGSGNHIALFSYYAVLNLAVFGVAWVRPWRVLNLVGFGFTFVVSSLWAWKYYTPAHYATTQPFLILFFLFYVAIGLLYARRPEHAPQKAVDGTLLFGTPLLAAGLQAGLLEGRPMAMALAAVIVAALYAVLAYATRASERLATLSLGYAVLAIGFATAAVPLALDADVTAQVWALEGAALLWLGLRQQRRLQVWAALALQGIAGIAWLIALVDGPGVQPALRNGVFVGGIVLALSLWCAARLLENAGAAKRGVLWFLLACATWTVAWLVEIDMQVPNAQTRPALGGWLALSLLLAAELRQRLAWARLGYVALAAIALGTALVFSYGGDAPSEGWGGWCWPLWLLAAAFGLWRLREPWTRGLAWGHVAALAGLALLAGYEAYARVGGILGYAVVWPWLAGFAPLAMMFAGTLREPARGVWPLAEAFPDYRWRWLLPTGAVLGLAWLNSLFHHGAADPLPFLPLLNPLELAQVAFLLLAVRLLQQAPGIDATVRVGLPAIAGFATLCAATLRAVHHLAGVPWNEALWSSMLGQTSLTVVWSILGVGAWVAGSRRGNYVLWLSGAVLMGVVLAKLVLVDRQHMGNIPGIVSFLAVGVLLTVVGYFAPSPPRRSAETPT